MHRLWLVYLLLKLFSDFSYLYFGYCQSYYDSHTAELWTGKLAPVDWGAAESQD